MSVPTILQVNDYATTHWYDLLALLIEENISPFLSFLFYFGSLFSVSIDLSYMKPCMRLLEEILFGVGHNQRKLCEAFFMLTSVNVGFRSM